MNRIIYYEEHKTKSDMLVMVVKIVRIDKDWEEGTTLIHLDNGNILVSSDSMKTLKARINE